MHKYEIIEHEIREIQIIQTENKTHVNRPGVGMVHRFSLAADRNQVTLTHYQRTTNGEEIFEQVAPFVPVVIRISGGAEPVEITLDQDTFLLEGPTGLKVKVETVEALVENATMEVVLQ